MAWSWDWSPISWGVQPTQNKDNSSIIRDIESLAPDLHIETLELEGEGDFCRAYTVNRDWIFCFAYNAEGSRSLEREQFLLPKLAPTLTIAIPNIKYFGHQSGNSFAFMGYRKIHGVPLTYDRFMALEPKERIQCANDLVLFLQQMHAFSLDDARTLGIPESDYPFCRTEEGIVEGSASEIYKRELARLLGHPKLAQFFDGDTQKQIIATATALVNALTHQPLAGDLPAALVHGDLSSEHILLDEEKSAISGVIDFTDAVITSPVLDFMYATEAYGTDIMLSILNFYGVPNSKNTGSLIWKMHQWHTVSRLLWALDHDDSDLAQRRASELTREANNIES